MSIGGEAADQMVRMMLSGTEVALRLGGSLLKNLLALTLALAKNHKTISGKVNMAKMLRQTRDIRQFQMTPEQYQQFKKIASKQKILFSTIWDADGRGRFVDVAIPMADLERANRVFSRIQFVPEQEKSERQQPEREERIPKKESRSGRDWSATRETSAADRTSRTTSERPSVESRLQGYQQQLAKDRAPAKTRTKIQQKTR